MMARVLPVFRLSGAVPEGMGVGAVVNLLSSKGSGNV